MEARKRLIKCLEWRHQNRVDFIREKFEYPEVGLKYLPIRFIGQDKLRNPLFLGRYGKYDIKGLLKSLGIEGFQNYLIKSTEEAVWEVKNRFPKDRQPDPNILCQATWIIDMEGISMSYLTHKPTIDTLISWYKIVEANYPENDRRIFIINASKVFTIGYAMFKPLLDKKRKRKMRIFNTNSEEWKKALLEEIDADQLPACYGGTMTDPDGNPNCVTKCPMGGLVPESYYLENRINI